MITPWVGNGMLRIDGAEHRLGGFELYGRRCAVAGNDLGAAQVTANYCVRIYDAKGDLSGPVAFDVNITHF